VHKLIVVHLLFTVTCERKFTILHESIRLILRQKSSSFLQESSCAECSSRGKRVSHVRLKSAWDSLVDSLRTFIVVQSNAQTWDCVCWLAISIHQECTWWDLYFLFPSSRDIILRIVIMVCL